MRAVVQRVLKGEVSIKGITVGRVGRGLVVLIAFSAEDDEKVIDYMLDKIIGLRIFEDENDKMNISLNEMGGGLLIVPNFTVYGDVRKGKRPSFIKSASPEEASEMFDRFTQKAKEILPGRVAFGVFKADMQVEILNDGPVTILLDSDKSF